MIKIVKVSAEFLRAWRNNVSHLVDAEGHLVGTLEAALETHLQNVRTTARARRRSIEQRVQIGTGERAREHTVSVVIGRVGINADDYTVTATIDGHRVVSGRDVLCAQMFQAHGECQLRWPNNAILKVVRDPSVRRPTFLESQQLAPRPEHCSCRDWGRPHPGTHYPTCPNNRLAPPDERAPSDALSEDEVRVLPPEALTALAAPRAPNNPAVTPTVARLEPKETVIEAAPLDPPDTCRNGCLEWATPKHAPIPPGQHHPTCTFARAWAIKTDAAVPRWLINLRTGEAMRTASRDEVAKADVEARRTGQPILQIDDVPYAVVRADEVEGLTKTAAAAPAAAPEVSP